MIKAARAAGLVGGMIKAARAAGLVGAGLQDVHRVFHLGKSLGMGSLFCLVRHSHLIYPRLKLLCNETLGLQLMRLMLR